MAAEDPKRDELKRRGQVDPFLREGRSPAAWLWVVGAAIVAALAVTFFVANRKDNPTAQNDTASYQGPPVTTGSQTTAPQSPQAGGRTNSSVPPTGNSTTVRP